MKKSAVFLILSFILLGFFACQIPKAIEIIGTPSARFAETVDVGSMFVDLLKNAINKDERLTIIPCTSPKLEIITYLIHTKLLDNKEFDDLENEEQFYESFPHSQDDQLYDHIGGVPLDRDKTLFKLDSSEEEDPEKRLNIPLSELGLVLPGFKFYDGKDKDGNPVPDAQDGVYKTRLYLSGSQIVDKSKIIIEFGRFDEENKYLTIDTSIIEKDDIVIGKSAIDEWESNPEGYSDDDFCPNIGAEIDIPITKEDIVVSFTLLIPQGETLEEGDFKGCNINVELVIWLPFKFEAISDDAALSFPDDSFFSSEDDVFGREDPDSDSLIAGIIESLSVDVKFQNNPFKGADLIISSKGVDIHNPIGNNDTLSFTITDDNMKKINDPENWPFIPNIKIGFAPGEKLAFPKEFNAIEFAFKAKVRYRKDFL